MSKVKKFFVNLKRHFIILIHIRQYYAGMQAEMARNNKLSMEAAGERAIAHLLKDIHYYD